MSLQDHVPHAVCETYACAKILQSVIFMSQSVLNFSHQIPRKDVIHGALTDGQDWIFIILKMNPDGSDVPAWPKSREPGQAGPVKPGQARAVRTAYDGSWPGLHR